MSKTSQNSLDAIRAQHTAALSYIQWAHIVLILGVGLWIGSPKMVQALGLSAMLSLAGSMSLALLGNGPATRCVVAAGFAMQAACLTFMASGHGWQIDMHMYFFAALAITVALFDVRAVFVAAGTIAVHHLLLNFIAPSLVFPAGADLARRWLAALLIAPEEEREAIVASVEARMHRLYPPEASPEPAPEIVVKPPSRDVRSRV